MRALLRSGSKAGENLSKSFEKEDVEEDVEGETLITRAARKDRRAVLAELVLLLFLGSYSTNPPRALFYLRRAAEEGWATLAKLLV